MAAYEPFWRRKSLSEMTQEEWESLCDGCGKCCLHKLENEDTGDVFYTRVACRLLDEQSCQCRDYPGRKAQVPDCIVLTPEQIASLIWLPVTCAYRLISEGKPLADWHPLVSGDPESVHLASMSVRGLTICETKVKADDYEEQIVEWIY